MHWTDSRTPALLEDLLPRLAGAPWPEVPAGFERIGPLRPMRQVLKGTSPAAPTPVVVKWNRPVTTTDRLVRRWRGGKGPREGRVLRHLTEAGIAVPRVLAYADDTEDLLVTEAIDGLAPLPPAEGAPTELVTTVADLLGRAWAAGLRHRDLHRGNVALDQGRPILVDVGGARLGGREAPVWALARARSGMGGDLSRPQRLRALAAWLHAAGIRISKDERARWARRVETHAARVARRYRRGRDRRATRSGRHFAHVRLADGVEGIRRAQVPEALAERAAAWLAGPPADATPLKGAGRVYFVDSPAPDESALVVKRYDAVAPGRLPRAIVAFRRCVMLENRGVAAPSALLALAGADRASLLVSEAVQAPDLHHYTAGGRSGAFAALPPARRRDTCERLGRFLRHLHDAEIRHRDLKAPNLLVAGGQGATARFLVADLDGARRTRGPVGWRRRASDLARLDANLDAGLTDRARVLDAYWRVLPRPPVSRKRFAAWIAADVRRKRGPSNRPR